MRNRFKLDVLAKKGGSAILGLTLDGSRLLGVVLRRTNGSVQLQQSFSVTLSLDPLTNDAELVGREIRNQLNVAGVRERRCIVGVPLQWALITQVKLPELPDADVDSFLQLEAERGFPCDVSTLMLATSHATLPSGDKYATLIGVPRNHVTLLEQALRAAQLKPVRFTLGIAALQPPQAEASKGVLALVIGESHVRLQVTAGGGIMALRTLPGVLDSQPGQRQLLTDVLAREVRITLAQLPAELRSQVRRIRVFGPRELAQPLADELELRLEALEFQVEVVTAYGASEFGVQVPAGTTVSPAFSLAAGQLAGRLVGLEFLPPRVTAWQQFSSRYSSGKMHQAALAAGVVLLAAIGAFAYQQYQLMYWQNQWNRIQPRVRVLQDMSANIHKYRPWFDDSVRGLLILRKLTESFPEDSSVTAKTVEIRDLTTVTCTGVARDYQALLKTIENLRKVPQFQEVNLGPTRGQSPSMQFTFNFTWSEGGHSAN